MALSTDYQQVKLVTDLLISLNPVFIAVFILGLISGVFFFSDLVNRLDRLSYRF